MIIISNAIARMKKHPAVIAVTLALVITLGAFAPGCTTTGDARTKLVAQIAVQYAVGKVIENNPSYAPRIAQIASEVGAVAGGEASTVSAVIALARAKIDFGKLSPADVTLINTLLSVVEAELEARVSAGVLSPEKAASVREVAGWIEQAALSFVPSSPAR